MKNINKLGKSKGLIKIFIIVALVLIAIGIENYCTSVTGDYARKIDIAESLWGLKLVAYSVVISGIITGIIAAIKIFINKMRAE